MRKVWEQQETEELVKYMLDGLTYADIAERFNVQYWQVSGKVNSLRQNGVKIPYLPENRRRVDYQKLKAIVSEQAPNPTRSVE